MNRLDRSRLPTSANYFPAQGLRLTGTGEWRTTRCPFHGGSDSMRINTKSGGWVCMSCGEKGGDVLAFHMEHHGMNFVEAAKDLGAWVPGSKAGPDRPLPFTARDALEVLRFESLLCGVAACNVARGVTLSDADRKRLVKAAGLIEFIAREVDR